SGPVADFSLNVHYSSAATPPRLVAMGHPGYWTESSLREVLGLFSELLLRWMDTPHRTVKDVSDESLGAIRLKRLLGGKKNRPAPMALLASIQGSAQKSPDRLALKHQNGTLTY